MIAASLPNSPNADPSILGAHLYGPHSTADDRITN
jgi:hypothetical protein